MLTIPSALLQEKNKLVATLPWVMLLELTMLDTTVVRFAQNTENVTYAGQTWVPMAFKLGEQGQSGDGKIQNLSIQIANTARALTPYVEAQSGLIGAGVRLIVVHAGNLGADYTALTLSYTVMTCVIDQAWISFTLGAPSPMRKRFPLYAANPLHCSWTFKGVECNFLSGAASNQVVSATVNAAGTGGTAGTQIVTGTTGTGIKFQASVTVSAGGITAVSSITVGGSYTVNPSANDPVTGGGLTGAQLAVVMGAETCKRDLIACRAKNNSGRFGGRPGAAGAPRFV